MQKQSNRSRKRYQTVLPSLVDAANIPSQESSAERANHTFQLQDPQTRSRIEKDERLPPNLDDHIVRNSDVLRHGSDRKQAAQIADSQLPYQRLLRERDYAKQIAAQLEFSDQATASSRGQNSSETDRPATESSDSSNPSQHGPGIKRTDGFGDQRVNSSFQSGPPSGSSALHNHTEVMERLHPQLGTERTPYATRNTPKARIVIIEPELENEGTPSSVLQAPDPLPAQVKNVGVNAQTINPSTMPKDQAPQKPTHSDKPQPDLKVPIHGQPRLPGSPPQTPAPKQERKQFDQLRSLIPPPLPLRHTGRSDVFKRAASPAEKPSTAEPPEYEYVEGVTLDTQPVAAKEKATGLPLPLIEARDIRDIPVDDRRDVYMDEEEMAESAIPPFNSVDRFPKTDRRDPFSTLKKKIQQSSAYQTVMPFSDH